MPTCSIKAILVDIKMNRFGMAEWMAAARGEYAKGFVETLFDEFLELSVCSLAGFGFVMFALQLAGVLDISARVGLSSVFPEESRDCTGLTLIMCEFLEIPLSTFLLVSGPLLLLSIELVKPEIEKLLLAAEKLSMCYKHKRSIRKRG